MTTLSRSAVTLGISSFNAEATLASALKCAAEQAWSELQILVVDDGSVDASPAIIRAAAAIDPRVTAVFLPENRGIPTVRNTIVDSASSEFIAFFDDDDTSHPERIGRQVDAILAHENAHSGCNGLVACNVSLSVTFQDGRVEQRTALGSADFPKAVEKSVVLDHALRYLGDAGGERLQGTGSLMLRRSTVQRLGGCDEDLRRSSDVDLLIRIVQADGCVIGLPDRLVHQVITSSPDKTSRQAIDARLLLLKKHSELLDSSREERGIRLWILFLYSARDVHLLSATFHLLAALLHSPISTMRRVRRQLVPRIMARRPLLGRKAEDRS